MVLKGQKMLNLFKSKSILTQSDTDFQIATFKWLLKNFGGEDFYQDTQLVLPTREFFPSEVLSPEQAAVETFEMVRKYAGLENWPCRLEVQEQDVSPILAPTLVVKNAPSTPLGTIQSTEADEIIISYNPSICNRPNQLVATFAHEISHYLTATANEPPPGGWDNWEFATDITATFLGFGIFMANSAFSFNQYTGSDSQGWQTNRSGYLSESEHLYALAIFLALKELPISNASGFLKPNLKKLLKRAVKEIGNTNIINELSKINYEPSKSKETAATCLDNENNFKLD